MWKNENEHLCQFRFRIRVLVKFRHGMDDWPPSPTPNNTNRESFMQRSNKIIHFLQGIKTLVFNDRRLNPVNFQTPTSLQTL